MNLSRAIQEEAVLEQSVASHHPLGTFLGRSSHPLFPFMKCFWFLVRKGCHDNLTASAGSWLRLQGLTGRLRCTKAPITYLLILTFCTGSQVAQAGLGLLLSEDDHELPDPPASKARVTTLGFKPRALRIARQVFPQVSLGVRPEREGRCLVWQQQTLPLGKCRSQLQPQLNSRINKP